MSRKRQVRRKRCGTKTRHASQNEAMAHIFLLVRNGRAGGGWLTPYKCGFCHSWHIGHSQGVA